MVELAGPTSYLIGTLLFHSILYFFIFNAEISLMLVNSAIVYLYHGENKLIFIEIMKRSVLYCTNMLSWIFIVLAH
jgi:hypothetical protein